MNEEHKTTSAGKWSVALALIPVGGVLLFLLLPMLGDHSGEAGLAAMVAIGVILYGGAHITTGTSLLGVALGILAIRKTGWRQGAAGLILNLSVLIVSGSYLTTLYHGISVDPDQLNIAVTRGETEEVKKLLARGFDVNHKHLSGQTPLHHAMGNREMAALLLANGANVNSKDSRGFTPLHTLCAHKPARHSAREWDGPGIFDLLVKHRADIEARTFKSTGSWGGLTPLHIAAQADNTIMIDNLLAKGANIGARTNNDNTPLYLAAVKGSVNAAKTLLENRADINARNHDNCAALHGAAYEAKKEMVEFLLDNGIEIDAMSDSGYSALHSAKSKEIVRLLLDRGADVNAKGKSGITPLHVAASGAASGVQAVEKVEMLLKHHAEVNAQDRSGFTPLHKAVAICQYRWGRGSIQKKVIELLLINGAKVDIRDNRGRRPLDSVRKWELQRERSKQYQSEIIQLLERATQK
jgi:ankyrin repeat protein